MFKKEVYISRRARLVDDLLQYCAITESMRPGPGIFSKPGNIILLLANNEAPRNYAGNTYDFRQDSTFLYFCGLNDEAAGFALVIDCDSNKTILFGNDIDMDDVIWMGPQPSVVERASSVGIEESRAFGELSQYIKSKVRGGARVHYIPPYRADNMILLNSLLDIPVEQLKEKASVELIRAVVAQRVLKDENEIAEMDHACNIGYDMHYTVMSSARLGMVEQELAGMAVGVAHKYGAGESFPTILSQNGETMHNHRHNQILTDGRLVVMDAGAEAMSNYCSDFTRTFPSSGKFNQRQSEIYNIVLDANNLAQTLAKPGIMYKEVHLAVARLITVGLKDLGLMKGDVDEAVAAGAHALFFPHGLGHNIGLDVHDMEDLGEKYVGYNKYIERSTQFGLSALRMARTLGPGMVVSDEPGIYFIPALIDQWKAAGTNAQFINFDKVETYKDFGGIRLEDDILITYEGCRLLGDRRLPITISEVEEAMRK